ncbi:MAG: nucleotidyltransferase domain-containing protein [Cytophagia bacterium]|nr:MAG: nucleotidyltransferase domain-containing protein [Cytophagales bacterium]TAG37417.1 MAG: nucleotidyltransferase domain-containing protein [Cytophagia bacterium]TAG71974.1 MAG: nucleotidyltransferase domain-containing protein [Runella slithyformis]TAG78458.1 MAG: nucleotidyltransferase domain-containing protein [Cytophagales bacterium]
MLTRAIALKTAKEFVGKCAEQNINFNKVILFGSTARDEARDDSDIDLLLVSDQFGHDQWENARLIARINKKYSTIEAHTYPTDYFATSDPFIDEVKKNGIEIK